MSFEFKFDGVMLVAVLGVAAVGGAAYYLKKHGGEIVDKVNPASDKNFVNQGTQSLLQSAGILDKDQTIGGAIYDATHEEYDPNQPFNSTEFSWSRTLESVLPLGRFLNPIAGLVPSAVMSAKASQGVNTGTEYNMGGDNFGLTSVGASGGW